MPTRPRQLVKNGRNPEPGKCHVIPSVNTVSPLPFVQWIINPVTGKPTWRVALELLYSQVGAGYVHDG